MVLVFSPASASLAVVAVRLADELEVRECEVLFLSVSGSVEAQILSQSSCLWGCVNDVVVGIGRAGKNVATAVGGTMKCR